MASVDAMPHHAGICCRLCFFVLRPIKSCSRGRRVTITGPTSNPQPPCEWHMHKPWFFAARTSKARISTAAYPRASRPRTHKSTGSPRPRVHTSKGSLRPRVHTSKGSPGSPRPRAHTSKGSPRPRDPHVQGSAIRLLYGRSL